MWTVHVHSIHRVNVLKFRTLYSRLFWPKFCFWCSCFLKYLVEWQTVQTPIRPLLQEQSALVCTVGICHFVRNLCVWKFRTFTVSTRAMWSGHGRYFLQTTGRHRLHKLPFFMFTVDHSHALNSLKGMEGWAIAKTLGSLNTSFSVFPCIGTTLSVFACTDLTISSHSSW